MDELDLLERLKDCRSLEALHAATMGLVKSLGFEYFIYGVQVNTSLTQPYRFVFSGYPKQWRERYLEAGYQEKDPTVLGCLVERRVVPLIWESRNFDTPIAAKLYDEAIQCGVGGGMSVYVQGGRGEAAMLSLATPSTPEKARRDVIGTLGRAQLLACYLHEAVQRIVLSKEAAPVRAPNLTKREEECLLWAAEGKTTWEIGHILKVSERTVVFHLQNAARKLGVNSRQHAVARALSMGLVAP